MVWKLTLGLEKHVRKIVAILPHSWIGIPQHFQQSQIYIVQLIVMEVFILPQDVQKTIQSDLNFAAACQAQTVAIGRLERIGA